MGWRSAGAAASLAALVGCAHGGKEQAQQHIDNSALTRLNEQQMQPIDNARLEESRARDALARAKANENEARTHLEVAKSEREVAVAQFNRAKAMHDLLVQQKAAPAEVARAADAQRTTEERVRAEDLKIDYLNKMIGVAQMETALADAHMQVTSALVERAKLQALQVADPNQLQGVDPTKINAQLAELQSREAGARKEAADRRTEAVDSYNKWQEADARVRTAAASQPSAPPPPMGTQAQQQPPEPRNTVQPAQQQPTAPPPPAASQPVPR